MRILLVVLSVFSLSMSHAQRGGGGGRSGGRQGGNFGMEQTERERPKMVEFNATKVAGIFNYNDEEAIDKIKIKSKEADLKIKVQRAIETYNIKVNEIAHLNKDNFDTLNVYVNAKMKAMRANRSQGSSRMGLSDASDDSKDPERALIQGKIRPAKTEVKSAEVELNKKLEAILSEKQYAKWIKYQAFVKEEQNPKPELNRSGESGMSRGGRQGGSMGGRMR